MDIESVALPTRWVIYATYDESGKPRSHALDQIQSYTDLGWEVLVVDTSPALTSERREAWNRTATDWFRRDNVGYDFISFREGLLHLTRNRRLEPGTFSLLLTNDSCYGPYMSLAPIFETFDRDPHPESVFGITDSREIEYHLQSYWLYFKPRAVPALKRFFETLPEPSNRQEAIDLGEIGLSRYLRKEGIALKALWPIDSLIDRFVKFHKLAALELRIRHRINRPRHSKRFDSMSLNYLLGRTEPMQKLNPTIALGLQMFAAGMTPFVKRQLLRENPYSEKRIPARLNLAELSNSDVHHLLKKISG